MAKRVCSVCGQRDGYGPSGMSSGVPQVIGGEVHLICKRCYDQPWVYWPGKKLHPKYTHLTYPDRSLDDFKIL